jgi:hypothetical protein
MKRVYLGKEVIANGVKINVKQVFGSGESDIRERVKRIASTAQRWLDTAIPELHHNMAPKVAAVFTECFKCAPDPGSITTAKSVLTTVSNSLKKAHGVKVRNDDDAYGYVNIAFGGRKHLTNGMVFHDSDGDAITRMGEIHVDKMTIRSNMTMAVITYIHEATHRFSNTDDYGDQGYFKSDGSDFVAPGLTWQQALNNADSYAYFVYKTMEAKFTSVIVT